MTTSSCSLTSLLLMQTIPITVVIGTMLTPCFPLKWTLNTRRLTSAICFSQKKRWLGWESQLTAVDFIWTILAVHASVTVPAFVDALPICTLELIYTTSRHLLVRVLFQTVLRPLVRSVRTVSVSIAAPERRHTRGVVALKGIGAAGRFGAGDLVGAI